MKHLDPFDRRAMVLSIGLHAALFALAWLSTLSRGREFEFITYEIELVSPPPAVQAEQSTPAQEELVVERPRPERPPEPEPEPEPQVRVEEPEPAPREPAPTPEPDPPPPAATAVPAAGPEPTREPDPARTGEGLNVRMEGLRRDYPEYWNNIIRQIQRCFRPPSGNWQASVTFVIRRDGSVADLAFVQRSGNATFDFEAMGAVECAGQGRFGPLPADLPYEIQPIRFEFRPSGGEE
jgi:outer membrane biosynthesis protein TonB